MLNWDAIDKDDRAHFALIRVTNVLDHGEGVPFDCCVLQTVLLSTRNPPGRQCSLGPIKGDCDSQYNDSLDLT